jgi:CRISPR-associated protein Cas2
MEILVAYDVSTESAAGRTRLRKVAKICEGFGQRVQKSVFECVLSEIQLVQLEHRLNAVVDIDDDSLRIYRLREPRSRHLRVIGRDIELDIRDPIVF